MKSLIVGLLLALAPVTAGAVEGTYRGRWHEVAVRRVDGARHSVEISTWNGRGCGGRVRGEANISRPSVLMRTANEADFFGRSCDVVLNFRGRRLSIQEGDGCLYWHGAACGFTGTLTLR